MKVVITQPTFLPWLGYIAQLAEADIFICLDNVQYSRRSWQTRNRIVSRLGNVDYINVNVERCQRSTTFKDVLISKVYNSKYISNRIKQYYTGLENIEKKIEFIEPLFSKYHYAGHGLADSNYKQLMLIKNILELDCKIVKASDLSLLDISQTATESLFNICKYFNATTYLSSFRSRLYMEAELKIFEDNGIKIKWQKFQHINYIPNKDTRFISHLSLVDYLMHNDINNLPKYLKLCNSYITE